MKVRINVMIIIILLLLTTISSILMIHYLILYRKEQALNLGLTDTFEVGKGESFSTYSIMNNHGGCVKDEATAIKIANVLFGGENDLSLQVEFIEETGTWKIRNLSDLNNTVCLLKKKNAEVIYLGKENDFSFDKFMQIEFELDSGNAIKIAQIMFESIYGDGITCNMPLIAEYNKDMDVFQIRTQLPEESIGGCAYVILKKATAEVIAFWGTK